MFAYIYVPTKSAMQAGRANEKKWVLRFSQEFAKFIEPFMGYTASMDTKQQIFIKFDTKEAAIAFAEKNNLPYKLILPKQRKRAVVSYADNFSPTRAQPWTH